MKKITALILCMIMVLSVGVGVSASLPTSKTIQFYGLMLEVPHGINAQLTDAGYIFTSDKELEDVYVFAAPYDEKDQIHTLDYNFNTYKLAILTESSIENKYKYFSNIEMTVDVYDVKESEIQKGLTNTGAEYIEYSNQYTMYIKEIDGAATFYGYMVHFRSEGYEYTFAITGLDDSEYNNRDAFVSMLKNIKKAENGKGNDVNADSIQIVVDGAVVVPDSDPVIVNDRTLVPIRAVAEKLHYLVDWDNSARAALISGNDALLKISIGVKEMEKIVHVYNQGSFETKTETIPLDVEAQIINDRTYLPLRAVGEALGCRVDWDNDTRTVIITSKP